MSQFLWSFDVCKKVAYEITISNLDWKVSKMRQLKLVFCHRNNNLNSDKRIFWWDVLFTFQVCSHRKKQKFIPIGCRRKPSQDECFSLAESILGPLSGWLSLSGLKLLAPCCEKLFPEWMFLIGCKYSGTSYRLAADEKLLAACCGKGSGKVVPHWLQEIENFSDWLYCVPDTNPAACTRLSRSPPQCSRVHSLQLK
jgi:hypothetical protein